MDDKQLRRTAPDTTPIEQSYLVLQDAFEQAITLEVMLARQQAARDLAHADALQRAQAREPAGPRH